MSLKRIALLVALEACSTRDPGPIGDCTHPAGTYTIGGPAVSPNGACDGVPKSEAFASGTIFVDRADGGYVVSTHGTTTGTDMAPCPAKLFACELQGSCTPDGGGVTQSFVLEISDTRVEGNLTAKFTTDAGGCSFTVPVTGSH